jgi:hypothetical protein
MSAATVSGDVVDGLSRHVLFSSRGVENGSDIEECGQQSELGSDEDVVRLDVVHSYAASQIARATHADAPPR